MNPIATPVLLLADGRSPANQFAVRLFRGLPEDRQRELEDHLTERLQTASGLELADEYFALAGCLISLAESGKGES